MQASRLRSHPKEENKMDEFENSTYINSVNKQSPLIIYRLIRVFYQTKRLKITLKTKPLLDFLTKKQHNKPNTTVTLSARKSIAKPWRFFYGSAGGSPA
jgi:hypothetical protein